MNSCVMVVKSSAMLSPLSAEHSMNDIWSQRPLQSCFHFPHGRWLLWPLLPQVLPATVVSPRSANALFIFNQREISKHKQKIVIGLFQTARYLAIARILPMLLSQRLIAQISSRQAAAIPPPHMLAAQFSALVALALVFLMLPYAHLSLSLCPS
jgi:hypothetical protein